MGIKNTDVERIGWIGAGVMGQSMCGHLLTAGYPVTVHTRTRAKAEALIAQGATWAATPCAVAESSTVVFTMVGFPADVESVYFGEAGILAASPSPTLAIDMTTTKPSLAVRIHGAASAKGVQTLDAPVSGGDVGARNAALSIMVGGDAEAVERARPLLGCMGKQIVHQGGPGAGQHTKMCNQIVISGTMVGVCESLLYAARAGLDLPTMLASIGGGAASCWTLHNLAPRMAARDFAAGFFVEHFIKDMEIALEEARRLGIVLPGLALVHQLYLAVQAQGHARAGTHALLLALEQLSGIADGGGD